MSKDIKKQESNISDIQIFITIVVNTDSYHVRQNYSRLQNGFALQKSKEGKEVE
jgi:hypothetical protein